MLKKLSNSQVINDNGDIDKTFGDKYTTGFRKHNKVIRLNWVINNSLVKNIQKITDFDIMLVLLKA